MSTRSADGGPPDTRSHRSVRVADLVRLDVEDGVATVRLDRPPVNALCAALQDELRGVADEVALRADVAAVVVTGGPTVFAAGADVREMAGWSHAEVVRRARSLQDAFTAVARLPMPTVAAVAGYALGGGCELALCCDYRVAGDNARLGQPEILLGLLPAAGGTQRLARLIGPARAKDLVLTGRHVDADEALRIGLVDQVVAPDDVEAAARAWARRFVGGPALALRAAKECVDLGLGVDLATGLDLERQAFGALFATSDAAAGMASFVESGPGRATFTGR
jgi:enoyl-CoA hydratase/carnithine racemase